MTPSISAADQARLDIWWQSFARQRQCPAELEVVKTRLVRTVAKGVLPDAGTVFVKVMLFPRRKDRRRYMLRALPAEHEARMIERVRDLGLGAPEVLMVRVERRLGWPRCSMLVTRELPMDVQAEPSPPVLAEVVARLCGGGLFHPDLHPGNLLPLQGGSVGVLDLQSARQRSAPLAAALQRQMLIKFLSHVDADRFVEHFQALADVGLVPSDGESAARAEVARLERRYLRSRIERCLTESTQFRVQRSLLGVSYHRRDVEPGALATAGGGELAELWIGDRAREVLQGEAPVLSGLLRHRKVFGGRHALYIRQDANRVSLAEDLPRMREGYRQYLALRGPTVGDAKP